MKVFSQLISAQIENKTSDYTATVVGRVWFRTDSFKFNASDGTNVRAFLRNDQYCVFGNSGTASQNIRFNRSAANALQLVTGDDVTAEGSTSSSCGQIDARAVNYSTAGLPSAASANKGRIVYDTTAGALKYDTGGTWTTVASGATTNRVNAMWDFVVGSSSQVTAGTATHSSLASAIAAAATGNSILVLQGSISEAITVNLPLTIYGHGISSVMTGAWTFTNASVGSIVRNLKIVGNITFNSGANSNFLTECFLDSASTVTDNGTSNQININQL